MLMMVVSKGPSVLKTITSLYTEVQTNQSYTRGGLMYLDHK